MQGQRSSTLCSCSWGFLKKKTTKKRGGLGSDLCHKEWGDQVAIHGSVESYRLSWANIVTLSKMQGVLGMWGASPWSGEFLEQGGSTILRLIVSQAESRKKLLCV